MADNDFEYDEDEMAAHGGRPNQSTNPAGGPDIGGGDTGPDIDMLTKSLLDARPQRDEFGSTLDWVDARKKQRGMTKAKLAAGRKAYEELTGWEKNQLTFDQWSAMGFPGWKAEGGLDPFDWYQKSQNLSFFGDNPGYDAEGNPFDWTEHFEKEERDKLAGMTPAQRETYRAKQAMYHLDEDYSLYGDWATDEKGEYYGDVWKTDPKTGLSFVAEDFDIKSEYYDPQKVAALKGSGITGYKQDTIQEQKAQAKSVYEKAMQTANPNEYAQIEKNYRDTLDIIERSRTGPLGYTKDAPDWKKQNLGAVQRNPFLGLASLLSTAVNPGHLMNFMMLNKLTRPGKAYEHAREQERLSLLDAGILKTDPSMFRKRKKRRPKRRPVCPPGVPWFLCPPGSSRGKTSKRKAQGGLVELAEGGPVNFAQGDLVKTNNDNNMEISDMVGRTTNTPDFKNTIKTSIDALNNFGLTGRTMVGAEEEEGIGIPTDIPTDVASMDVDETENDYMNMFAETIDPSTGETEVADYAEDEEFEETPGGGLTEIAGAEEIDEETFGGDGGLPVMGARGGGYVDSPTGGLDDLVPAYIEGGEIPRYSRGTMGGGGGLSNYLSSRHLDRHLPQITPEGRQAARLSGGEFVVPADAVADAGGGNSRNGALQFTNLIKNIRLQKHGTTKQPPKLPSSVSGLMGLA